MIVVHASELHDTERHARGPGWESLRMLVKRDGVGYSLNETRVQEGAELHLHYKHHYEANYCTDGEGEVVDVASGAVYPIRPGTLYVLDKHDKHILRATRGDLRLVCVFNPPLTGTEVHGPDGSYGPPAHDTL
ncbi:MULTISPECIES: ectoine synthase [Bordetella]|uniref:L-ectoine synthase n=2 Tax=Bordetella TaxID=517 RepID=A0A261W008_9BORD|nr:MULTISPECIES: ectoine synthase [Bordetella]MDM9559736.1 ectoine synthase [Bordetella petrii]OZI79371.1 L-ectoine synthase [Bordetella genomosp. 2]